MSWGRRRRAEATLTTARPETIRAAWFRPAFEKARVRRAAPRAGELGKFLRDAVIVSSLRKLRRDAEAPVAFVQVAAAGHVFVIGGELAIMFSARPTGPFAG